MKSENIKKLLNIIYKDRIRVVKILQELLKDNEDKLKIDNKILKALFLKNESLETNDKTITITKLINDCETLELYKFFDFSNFDYSNLIINFKTLSIMKENNIKFYTDKIYEKSCVNLNFNGIVVNGNFDGWDVRQANFKGVLGLPVINSSKVKNKSLRYTDLSDTLVTGSCDGVDVIGTSFEGAHIDYENFSFEPQKVLNASLLNTNLYGVPINGNLDNVIVQGTNFKGYIGKIILNVDKIPSEQLENNIFSGVIFNGDLSKKSLHGNDFTGSRNAIIDCDNFCNFSNNNFANVCFKNFNTKIAERDLKNKFDDSVILYDSFNKQSILKKYKEMVDMPYYYSNISEAHLVNQDQEMEYEIKKIIDEEIAKQKIKTRTI